jgi:hypothetical protein
MLKVRRSEIDNLLARHGIAPLTAGGTDSQAAASGGRIANVHIARRGQGTIMSVTIDGVLATSACPLDLEHAKLVVQAFREHHLLPADASFEHMLADLLVKMSAAYVDGGAEELEFEAVHLHPTSYHIGRVNLQSATRVNATSRLAPDSHDRHAVFSHRHGDDAKFPR